MGLLTNRTGPRAPMPSAGPDRGPSIRSNYSDTTSTLLPTDTFFAGELIEFRST
jgi:hypothetical protein